MTGLIAHEWIEPHGGSENVLEAIAANFPDADIVTPWNNAPERLAGRTVRELWLSRTPLRRNKALALLALTRAWRSAIPATAEYDWVLASSHSLAHNIRLRGATADVPKLVYAHSPARYIWTPELDERGVGVPARLASAFLRPMDRRRAGEATAIAANSRFVAERIARSWEQSAQVIYPPVDIARIRSIADWSASVDDRELAELRALPEQFLLGASRFIPYKRLDLVIRAGEATGLPVVLAGAGPIEDQLREAGRSAGVPVHFVIAPSDAMLYALYQRAAAFVFPAIEDFGIMPIEAMATGTPVVAAAIGGSAETVSDGVSGVHIASWEDHREIAAAVERAIGLPSGGISQWADRFDRARFDRELVDWVNRSVGWSAGQR